MGRSRATKRGTKLPPYVYRKPQLNLVEHRPYLGDGHFGRTVYLRDENNKALPANASEVEIFKAYSRQIHTQADAHTLAGLLVAYFKSPRAKRLAPKTLKSYRYYESKIITTPLSNGRTFGDVPLEKLTRPMIAKYRDSMADTPIMANRHLQFLSSVFSWGMEQGHLFENVAMSVEKNPAQSSDRYVTDAEYQQVYALANDFYKAAMELAYICRARTGELLALTTDKILEEGIYLKRTKKSESEITEWSDRLHAATDRARAWHGVASQYVLHGKTGDRVRDSAFKSGWQRLMAKALQNGLTNSFSFHSLKAKGITDHTEHWGGHRSERMRQVYVRLPDRVSPTR